MELWAYVTNHRTHLFHHDSSSATQQQRILGKQVSCSRMSERSKIIQHPPTTLSKTQLPPPWLWTTNNSSHGRPPESRVSLGNTGSLRTEAGAELQVRILGEDGSRGDERQNSGREGTLSESFTAGLGLKGYPEMYCSLYRFTNRASNTMETEQQGRGAEERAQVHMAEQRLGRKEIGKFPLLVPRWPLLEVTTECSIK